MSSNPYGSTAPVTYGMLLFQADQIRNKIDGLFVNIYNTVFNNTMALNTNINNRFTTIENMIRQQTSSIVSANSSLYNQILNSVAGQINGLRTVITQSENNIRATITSQTNILNNSIQVSEIRLQNKISDSTNAIKVIVDAGNKTILERLNQINTIPGVVLSGVQQQIVQSQQNIINSLNGVIQQTEADIINTLSGRIAANNQTVFNVQSTLETKLNVQYSGLQSSLSEIKSLAQQIDTSPSLPDLSGLLPPGIREAITFFNSFATLSTDLPRDIEKAARDLQSIFTKLEQNGYSGYQEFINDLNNLGLAGGLAQTLWNMGKVVYLLTFGLMQSYSPFVQNITTLSQSQANSTLLSPPEVLTFFKRFGQDRDFTSNYLNKLGYSDADINRLIDLSTQVLPENVARYAWMNKKIDEATHDRILEQNGYSPSGIEIIKRTYLLIPPLSDLITMAVREAFSPDIANLFGQYEGYPEKLTPFAAQHGLTEEWSKAYWAAHWSLPSPSQGFEMLHRGVIDVDTLKLLLRALDIMPFWREKLIELSYKNLRLVDVRRFYELGTIDEDEMYNEYLALGYNAQKAKWATEWTKEYISQGSQQEQTERRLLSQSVIIKAYNTGRLTRQEAVTNLTYLKYDINTANLILDIYTTKDEIEREDIIIDDNKKRMIKLATDGYAKRLISETEAGTILVSAGYTQSQVVMELQWTDYEVETAVKANIVKYFAQLYTEFQIDRDTFILTLSGYGFQQAEIDHVLIEYDLLREVRLKQPSLETIIRWYRKGVIDRQQFIDELKGLGFGNKYIVYYLMEEGEDLEQ